MLRLATGACNPGGVLGGDEGMRECLGTGKIGSLDGVSCGERPAPFRGARKSKILVGAELGFGQRQD